jgi:hypothetical protein
MKLILPSLIGGRITMEELINKICKTVSGNKKPCNI